jgi:hypothetical protein
MDNSPAPNRYRSVGTALRVREFPTLGLTRCQMDNPTGCPLSACPTSFFKFLDKRQETLEPQTGEKRAKAGLLSDYGIFLLVSNCATVPQKGESLRVGKLLGFL